MAAGRERLATPDEVAEYIGRTVGTLANWRSQSTGPTYIGGGHGTPVRYRWCDVETWLKKRTRQPAA